jgi:hypothetical protein
MSPTSNSVSSAVVRMLVLRWVVPAVVVPSPSHMTMTSSPSAEMPRMLTGRNGVSGRNR